MQRQTRNWRRKLQVLSLVAVTLAVVFVACQSKHKPLTQDDTWLRRQLASGAFDLEVVGRMENAINRTVAAGMIPGGVLWIEHDDVPFDEAFGNRALVPEVEPMTRNTVFDIASLTKVVATAPAVMKLVEEGKVQLDDPARKFIPEFVGQGKDPITIRQLLTHTSGLRPGISTSPEWSGYDTAIGMACRSGVQTTPGTDFRYSDINFIVLAEVVQRVTGRAFDEFVVDEIFRPLQMNDTGFHPGSDLHDRIAPTERVKGEMLRGTVQDPTARYMGGVAGHAGLFSTVYDLARFCRMLLNGGELDGVRVLAPETVRLMTTVQSPSAVDDRRGLGWDIDSGYSRPRGRYFPIGSYGHTGYSGTSLWIDPFSRTFWIFLSNRLHPDGTGNVLPLQAELADLTALAVKGFDFSVVPGALPPSTATRRHSLRTPPVDVLNGIDVLMEQGFAALRGRKVGLITNHTGRDRSGRPTIDLLHEAPDVELVALFSPEHGIRGELDTNVEDGRDAKTGLPIYSLYGERRQPAREQLVELDTLVFDIQDIGCRYYTYISTMGNCMEAAAAAGKQFVVLDRLNPITGSMVDGPVLLGNTDFVGWHPIPVRHGMTVGELARLFKAERGIDVTLSVIPLRGWRRDLWLDETTVPWVDTSPNMRSLTQAALYPGVGLLEMNPLSVGRGTETPFELFGAPYVDGELLAERLNAVGILGVRFDPIVFTPEASKFAGERCEGVRVILQDRYHCDVVNIGVAAAGILHQLYPEQFEIGRFARLLKHAPTLAAIERGDSLTSIRRMWQPAFEEFLLRREPFLIYANEPTAPAQ